MTGIVHHFTKQYQRCCWTAEIPSTTKWFWKQPTGFSARFTLNRTETCRKKKSLL